MEQPGEASLCRPGDFQVECYCRVNEAESKEFFWRVRKSVGDADKSASGSERVSDVSPFLTLPLLSLQNL